MQRLAVAIRVSRIALAFAFVLAPSMAGRRAHAEAPPARAPRSPDIDRVALRLVSPETGGVARPRFFTEREVAFFTRIEALMEQTPLGDGEYPDRYVRSAVDRMVARAMLASLMIQRGAEPPDLPRLAAEARADLAERVGGAPALEEAMKAEGIAEAELTAFLFDEVRASYYVDKAVVPILAVSEDALREAYRRTAHPFRGKKFEDVRLRIRRWVVTERLRAAEIEFLQGARARIRTIAIPLPTTATTATTTAEAPVTK